jgi:DNA (cytosine-5)-methyltransferase 1
MDIGAMKKTNKENENRSKPLTYISLFSNAGIGCYGFKQENFECVATNELLPERLKIQKFNRKCKYESGYILGDITLQETKKRIKEEIQYWKKEQKITDIDVIIATPPCQGMSVANLKKKNELNRNSLVVEAIDMVKEIKPKFFIFENVRGFLKAQCIDNNGALQSIGTAIELNLSRYNILQTVIDFKFYGNPSQRTRALVIGTRKDLCDITPYDLFPTCQEPITVLDAIGHLKSLSHMGDIDESDIFHNFRPYPKHMLAWIDGLREGESAFDNKDIKKKPHQIIDGRIIINKQKNGDKYRRCYWDKPGYCIHTRNDLFASQMTIHPCDNRVFSIRELMILMSIPYDFRWSDKSLEDLNKLPLEEKKQFLKKEELNIRRTIGESVPTIIFKRIAANIKNVTAKTIIAEKDARKIILKHKLDNFDNLYSFIETNLTQRGWQELLKISELANSSRLDNAAYYTSQDICFSMINDLPAFEKQDTICILEPSVGLGSFIPLLLKKFANKNKIIIDVIDIDPNSIKLLKLLLKKIIIPHNCKINFINDDFLLRNIKRSDVPHNFCSKLPTYKKYDIVIGNPPFKKITRSSDRYYQYKQAAYNQHTSNICGYFVEKSMSVGKIVSLIVPKTLMSAPEFNKTRELMNGYILCKLCDYGEKAFNIKIETVSFIINTIKPKKYKPIDTKVDSYITNSVKYIPQSFICDERYPYWLLYRDGYFDSVAQKLNFDIFTAFRDRQITNALLKKQGKYRVLKSRNIGEGVILDKENYDSYIDKIDTLSIRKFLNKEKSVLIPNLTYFPRACFLPRDTIADGSVAIAVPKNGDNITKEDLTYYSTDEFRKFYAIARNLASRTMNIDSNSIFFFGKLKQYVSNNK